jgi:hypothetical protein
MSDTGQTGVYKFPIFRACEAGGRVDMSVLSERTRNNNFYARAVIGREVSVPSLVLVA